MEPPEGALLEPPEAEPPLGWDPDPPDPTDAADVASALVSAACAVDTDRCAACVAVWSDCTFFSAARHAVTSTPGFVGEAVGAAVGADVGDAVGAAVAVAAVEPVGSDAVNPSAPAQPCGCVVEQAAAADARWPSAVDSAASAFCWARSTARCAAATDPPADAGDEAGAADLTTAVKFAVPPDDEEDEAKDDDEPPLRSCSSVSFACASVDFAWASAELSAVPSTVASTDPADTVDPTDTGTVATVPEIGNDTVADEAGCTVPVACSVALTGRMPATAVR